MKKMIDLKSLALGALLGASVVLSVAALPHGASRPEYKQVTGDLSDQQLDDYAREGWVVDDVEKGRHVDSSRWHYYLLKRPKND
jgi:hypothetical protein